MHDPWFKQKPPYFADQCSFYTLIHPDLKKKKKKSGEFYSVLRRSQDGDLCQEARDGGRVRGAGSGLQATKCCVYLSHSVINHPEIWPRHLFREGEVAHTVSHYKLNIIEFRAGDHTSPWRNNSPKFLPRADF